MEPNYLTKVRKETIIYLLKTLMVWEMKKLTIETINLLWTNEWACIGILIVRMWEIIPWHPLKGTIAYESNNIHQENEMWFVV